MKITGNEDWIGNAVANGLVSPDALPPGTRFYKAAARRWQRPPGVKGGVAYRVELSTDRVTVVSEANRRDHWAVRRKRRKAQVDTLALLMRNHSPPGPEHPDRYRITLTRYGYRRLDTDNLAGAFKGLRDFLAEWIGMDDGDDRLEWVYRQERCKPGIGLLIEGAP